jgi:hypothetical protein
VKDLRLPFNYRALAIGLAVAAMLGDAWLASLRCSMSPRIDGSRLAFGVVVQVVVVASPILVGRFIDDEDESVHVLAGVLCVASVLASLLMVRQAWLLGDTATDKFHPSSGYLCPGVRPWSMLPPHRPEGSARPQ